MDSSHFCKMAIVYQQPRGQCDAKCVLLRLLDGRGVPKDVIRNGQPRRIWKSPGLTILEYDLLCPVPQNEGRLAESILLFHHHSVPVTKGIGYRGGRGKAKTLKQWSTSM